MENIRSILKIIIILLFPIASIAQVNGSCGKGNRLYVGLAAYYKLDETSGNALDAIGLHNGTVTGATQNVAGKIGTCYTFDGTDDYVNIGTVSTSSVFTYSAWVKTSSTAAQGIVVGKSIPNGAPYLRVKITSGVAQLLKNSVAAIGESTGNAVNTGAFVHVVVTYDASGNYIFYINNTTVSGTNLQTFTFGSFLIGSQEIANEWFNGQIDEVLIANRVYTAAEVSYLYNSGSGRTCPF